MPAVEQSPSVGFEQLLLAVCLTSGAFLLPPYGPPYPHSGRRREEEGGEEERGGGRGAGERKEREGGRRCSSSSHYLSTVTYTLEGQPL